jgi:hypothetical protein
VKHFGKPWRTDAFLQHLRKQHGEKWKEYESSDMAAREKFYEVSTKAVAYGNTLDAHLDEGESLLFWVRRTIVNRVVGEMLFDPNESDEMVEAALSIFKRMGLEWHEEPARSILIRNLPLQRCWRSPSLSITLALAYYLNRQATY